MSINIAALFSEIIFFNTFFCMKIVKTKINKFFREQKMHLSLQLLGLVDKQKIDGAGYLFYMKTNLLLKKEYIIFNID